MISTPTVEIKNVQQDLKTLSKFGINMDLDFILFNEFEGELPNDINNPW